jgi:2-polyprenyl-6-methoxyphenol hydroxylase-like FAD-dependent oxidoreductase
MGWRVPELLEQVRDSGDLYFDSVSRVRLDTWSHGRIVLVSDAADCISLLGEGSSMAITGAATLAQALVTEPADPRTALGRYEHSHRKRLLRHQRGVAITSHLLVPATRPGTGHVAAQVGDLHRALVGTEQSPLDQRGDPVHRGQQLAWVRLVRSDEYPRADLC